MLAVLDPLVVKNLFLEIFNSLAVSCKHQQHQDWKCHLVEKGRITFVVASVNYPAIMIL